ncbi:hypothetical protein M3C91_22230 [Oceanobacillus sojae]|nr:hypothetical protein [Oceanobacillus sojae]MCT1905435.1 hypothetical protein [Oceanobacillus sojae]
MDKRIIEIEDDAVFLVDIDAASSMPKKELIMNLMSEIQQFYSDHYK